MQYDFPENCRPARVEEREQFYRESFPAGAVQHLQERWNQPVLVVDVGTESTWYRPRFKEYKGKLVRIRDYETLEELHDKIVEYAPEDFYYRMIIETGRVEVNPEKELVFDLDPENVECRRCERVARHGDLPRHRVFCDDCFATVAAKTRRLATFLETHFDALQVVYSGRGFHVHVQDDAAFKMTREERKELAERVVKEFPIDVDVTGGDIDIVRLPGSLHGLVSRIVTPVAVDELSDPEHILHRKSVPDFLDTGT